MNGRRIGSLCSGYGGLDMAVQQVFGGELAWVADPDPGAAAVLAHHHPNVLNLGDITRTNWEDVARVDLLCGGYPCQPFSDAGLRLGVEDERHIWPHFATAIRVLRPRIVVLENVRGHLGRGFDAVLADLAGLGFDAEWCTVRASEVGAPHRRERLFIVATSADAPPADEGRLLGSRGTTKPAGRPEPGNGNQPAPDAADHGHERGRLSRGRRPGPADGGIAVADADRGGQRQDQRDVQPRESDACRCAAADAQGARRQGPGSEPTGSGPERGDRSGDVQWGAYEPAVRRWEHVTGRAAPRPTEPGRTGERLSPVFVEWLMGLPAGHVTDVPGLSRNAQLKALGNGVVPQQAVAALVHLIERRAAA